MIILPTMRGVISRKGYSPPALLSDPAYPTTITGSGTTTPTVRSAYSTFFAYADRVISGQVYWEIVAKCGVPIFGIAQSTTSLGAYGGYSPAAKGAVVDYSYNGTTYVDGSAATGSDAQLQRGVDKRFGIAVDTVAKTIWFLTGGVVRAAPSINTTKLNAGPLYPHLGGQNSYAMSGETCGDGSVSAQFCFGPAACAFAPPAGYKHL